MGGSTLASPQDRQYLATRAGGSKSFKVMETVKRVDAVVQSGLTEKGLKYNESLNDFMFVRRVYESGWAHSNIQRTYPVRNNFRSGNVRTSLIS